MVRLPTVESGNWQPPVPPASVASQLSTPSVTVTVPRGTTPTAVTWTVTVTAPLATDGSGESLVMTVLVGMVLTTITSDVAPLKPPAVNTRRRGPSAPEIARSVYATRPIHVTAELAGAQQLTATSGELGGHDDAGLGVPSPIPHLNHRLPAPAPVRF